MTRAVDATVAFASLYQRWFDDAPALTGENERQARSAVGSFVADVLALWDEGARDYAAGGPVILRLETCDLASFAMRGPYMALFLGNVETEAPVAVLEAHRRVAGPSGPATLRWRNLRPLSYAIGRRVAGVSSRTDGRGLLVGLEVLLDDGGRIALGGGRPLAYPYEATMPAR